MCAWTLKCLITAVGDEVTKLIGLSEDYSLVPMETMSQTHSNGPISQSPPSDEEGAGHLTSEEEL